MNQIKPGDFVRIQGQDTVAEVLSVKGNDLEVALGLMKVKVKRNKVELAEAPTEVLAEEGPNMMTSSGVDTKDKLMHFQFELDVRGKMKDEIMTDLSAWVDDALLLGIKEAKIVHGRGSGILKDIVRSILKNHKEIQSITGESQDYVTVVRFREE